MAQFPQGFSARTVAPQGNFSQLPISSSDGWPMVITASEMKASKGNANNGYLELNVRIIEGEHTGQEGKYRINLFNENAKTVEIAARQLSALCHVCNNPDAVDSSQLHNQPFRGVVGLQKKANADDADMTEIKGVKHMDGSDPGKSNGAGPAAAPAPPAPPQQAPQAPVQPAAPQQAAPAWGAAPAPAQAQPAAPAAPAWNGAAPAAPAQPTWAAPQPAAGAAAPPWAGK